jgi:hypothetical protein
MQHGLLEVIEMIVTPSDTPLRVCSVVGLQRVVWGFRRKVGHFGTTLPARPGCPQLSTGYPQVIHKLSTGWGDGGGFQPGQVCVYTQSAVRPTRPPRELVVLHQLWWFSATPNGLGCRHIGTLPVVPPQIVVYLFR